MNCFPSFHIQANKNKTRSEHFFLLKCNDEGVRTHGSSAQKHSVPRAHCRCQDMSVRKRDLCLDFEQ